MRNRCADCPYRWQEEDESFPTCHFESQGEWDKAPCEYDNEE